jgi:hypoxanthine phosphoribosyltransferase
MRIGIVGSMHYTEKMIEVQNELIRLGHDAFLSGLAAPFIGKSDEEKESIKISQKLNDDAIREFWRHMQDGDAILVLNLERHGIPNYIGGNTLMEIGFAHVLDQKIFLLNPIPDIPYYKSEVEAVRPIILDGDLSKIEQDDTSPKQLSYYKFEATISRLSQTISNDGFQPDIIVAISRGGWIPARLLSKKLGIKKLSSYGVTYADAARTSLISYDSPSPEIRERKILLVEDYLESGKSMKYCAEQLRLQKNEVRTFAVGYSEKSLIVPDYSSGKLVSVPKLPWD